jgi:hypothetical protein
VSWLPPGHPRANVTEAASKIREIILFQNSVKKQQEEEDAMSLDSDMEASDDEEVRIHTFLSLSLSSFCVVGAVPLPSFLASRG